MLKTEYLYGVAPTKYGTIQVELAQEKIKDAKLLLRRLRKECDAADDPFSLAGVHRRVEAVNEAVKYNENLIAEAKGEEV